MTSNNNIYYLGFCQLESGLSLYVSGSHLKAQPGTHPLPSSLLRLLAGLISSQSVVLRSQFLTSSWPKTSLDTLPCELSHSSLMTWQLASSERSGEWVREYAHKKEDARSKSLGPAHTRRGMTQRCESQEVGSLGFSQKGACHKLCECFQVEMHPLCHRALSSLLNDSSAFTYLSLSGGLQNPCPVDSAATGHVTPPHPG